MRNFVVRAAGLLFVLVSLVATPGDALARAKQFFQPHGAVAKLAKVENAPGVHSKAFPVGFNHREMLRLVPGEEVEVSLPNGYRYPVVFEYAQSHGGGIDSWVGHLKDRGVNNRVIVTTGPGGSFGTIQTPDGTYRIAPGGDHDWLVDMAQEQMYIPIEFPGNDAIPVRTDDLMPDLGQATMRLPREKSHGPEHAVIDLMFVVTQGLANRLGTTLATRLNSIITQANAAYTTSGVAMTLRLVNITVVNYPDDSNDSLALNSISPGTGSFNATVFGNIETIRNAHGADMVAFLRNGGSFSGSGIAWVPTPIASSATRMYSTVQGCVLGCESVPIHEIGHNMGLFHDRATDTWQGSGVEDPASAFNYGYAFCKSGALTCNPVGGGCTAQPECSPDDVSNFSEIMAYFHFTTDRLMRFSNPLQSDCAAPGGDGVPRICGVAQGTNGAGVLAKSADGAAVLNANNTVISAFKLPVAGTQMPGSLQFTATSFSGAESGGTLTFTVSRANIDGNGAGGAVSVNYAVTGGTATAGVDFVVTSGTLNWGVGDAADKTFSVVLVNDMATEGIETFTATLSNPAGAPGVYLGSPSSATGTIVENWPPGGTMPAGFVAGAGSSAAWAIASDFSTDGDGISLKSGAIPFPCPTTCPGPVPAASSVEFSGTFAAGPVSFGYQVDSYPGNGFFEFLVDGVVTLSDSGVPGAKSFTTTLAAGAHVLTWRYRPTLYFPCSIASPAPPQGAGCADRAWIDSISLPLPLANSSVALGSSVNPSSSGQSVTFTATVSGTSGTPTGTVQFRDGSTAISGCSAVTLASGAAACSTAALGVGTHSITAVYSGSTTYATSTSSLLSQVVSSGPQLLSANPATLDFGGQSMNTTSPVLTTTLTNTSGSPVTVTSVTPPSDYAVASNDCTTLAVSATCVIGVTFTPGTVIEGAVNGALLVSYDGGGPTVVGLAGIAERSLVTHYYRSILGRAPDTGGKAYWLNEAARVQGLQASVSEVWYTMAMTFYFSPEYAAFNRDDTGFVTDLYNTFFNRAPDSAGLSYWVSQLASGMPREGILTNFMFSAEFAAFTQAIFGAPAVRGELNVVMDLYRGLLSRLPDDGGFNYYVRRFRNAQCAGDPAAIHSEVEAISSFFINSPEYAARGRANGQFVSDLYNAFMRRGNDLGGTNYWINELVTGARAREGVRQFFRNSPEFSGRVLSIISETCIPP